MGVYSSATKIQLALQKNDVIDNPQLVEKLDESPTFLHKKRVPQRESRGSERWLVGSAKKRRSLRGRAWGGGAEQCCASKENNCCNQKTFLRSRRTSAGIRPQNPTDLIPGAHPAVKVGLFGSKRSRKAASKYQRKKAVKQKKRDTCERKGLLSGESLRAHYKQNKLGGETRASSIL